MLNLTRLYACSGRVPRAAEGKWRIGVVQAPGFVRWRT